MCLLIYKPAGQKVAKDHFERGFKSNSDGGGFAYVSEGKVIIRKPFWNVEDMWKECEPLMEAHQMIIHFRITTHGGSTAANTHPFDAGGGWVMGHNGMISKATPTTVKGELESDTRAYIREFIAPITECDHRFPLREGVAEMMKNQIGHSKLVFINGKGEYVIVNEGAGAWDNGIWYSNCSYSGPRNTNRTATNNWSQTGGYNGADDYYRGSTRNVYNTNRQLVQRIAPYWEKPTNPVICELRKPKVSTKNTTTTKTDAGTETKRIGFLEQNQTGTTSTQQTSAPTSTSHGSGLFKVFNTEAIVFKRPEPFDCACCGRTCQGHKERIVTFLSPRQSVCRQCYNLYQVEYLQ